MEHKHLTHDEIIELFTREEKTPDLMECEKCQQKILQFKKELLQIKDTYYQPIEKMAEKYSQQYKTAEEFIQSLQAENISQGNKTYSENFKTTIKWIYQILIPATVLLTIFNFYYDSITPQKYFSNIDNKIPVIRNGFWFGNKTTSTNKIICGKDQINTNLTISIKCFNHIEVVSQGPDISIKKNKNKYNLFLHKGIFYIHFSKQNSNEYHINLPDGSIVLVTGTELFFNLNEKQSQLLLLSGSAIMNKNNIITNLSIGKVYEISKREIIITEEKNKLTNIQTTIRSLSTFAQKIIPPFSKTKPDSGSQIENTPLLTVEELSKKYGPLTIIKTKNGKEYIGAFQQDGDTIHIYTTKGKISITSDSVEAFLPY